MVSVSLELAPPSYLPGLSSCALGSVRDHFVIRKKAARNARALTPPPWHPRGRRGSAPAWVRPIPQKREHAKYRSGCIGIDRLAPTSISTLAQTGARANLVHASLPTTLDIIDGLLHELTCGKNLGRNLLF